VLGQIIPISLGVNTYIVSVIFRSEPPIAYVIPDRKNLALSAVWKSADLLLPFYGLRERQKKGLARFSGTALTVSIATNDY
jgi:hypothetical protein